MNLKEQFINLEYSTSYIKKQLNNYTKNSINECFKLTCFSDDLCNLISVYIINILKKYCIEDEEYPDFFDNKNKIIDLDNIKKLVKYK